MNKEFIPESKKAMAIIMLLLSCLAYGQGGWIRKYDLGMPETGITSILFESNDYWNTTVSADTAQLPTVVFGTFVAKLDINGNVVSKIFISHQDKSIEGWNKG